HTHTAYYSHYQAVTGLPSLHSFPTRRSSDLIARSPFPSIPNQYDCKEIHLGRLWALKRSLHEYDIRSEVRAAAQAEGTGGAVARSEEHTSELQSRVDLVCRLLLEKKKRKQDD